MSAIVRAEQAEANTRTALNALHVQTLRAEKAEADLADMDRMLRYEWKFHTDDYPDYDDYCTDLRESAELATERALRARAEEGSDT